MNAPAADARVRLSIIGVIVFALFCALFTRLWFLQVASAGDYRSAAISNRVREVQSQAPRGRILDRNGNVLVDNVITNAVTIDRNTDPDDLEVVVDRLSEILEMTPDAIRGRLNDQRISQYAPVPIQTDVSIETITYIEEHSDELPGVDTAALAVRRYPNGTLAAHVLGYVGEISDEELAKRGGDYLLGQTIGKSGTEYAYEDQLRGKPSVERVEIDAHGDVVRVVDRKEAERGHDVVLSLDLGVQQVAEETLADAMTRVRTLQNKDQREKFETFNAPVGSVVVLDADTGGVVAMASSPTFDPNEFVNGIPTTTWEYLNDKENYYPLNNRAAEGLYAPGSVFKIVSGVAGMRAGVVTPYSTVVDEGKIWIADRYFFNAGNVAHGTVDLRQAMVVSSDVYFYSIGYELWRKHRRGEPGGDATQETAREWGFGSPTGIEIGGDPKGRVPDAAWKQAVHDERPDAFPYPDWQPGDSTGLAIGQGDLLVSPLQLACAYAALANGGSVPEPRVGARVVDDEGKVVKNVAPKTKGTIDIPPDQKAQLERGLEGVVADPSGTAAPAFSGFPFNEVRVAGKTGTAQRQGQQNTSLFVGWTESAAGRYVVAVVIEEAGYGASVAAPVARRVMEAVNGLPLTDLRIQASSGND